MKADAKNHQFKGHTTTSRPSTQKLFLSRVTSKDGQRFVADILLKRKDNGESKNNEPMFIEVAVTHPCKEEKIASGIRIIELSITQEEDIQSIVNSSFSLAPNIQLYNIKNTAPPHFA